MIVKKINSTKWHIEMSDDEVAEYVHVQLEIMIKVAEMVKPAGEPKQTVPMMLMGLVSALKEQPNNLVLLMLEAKSPLLVNLVRVQSDINSPTSECPLTKPEPPNESDTFSA